MKPKRVVKTWGHEIIFANNALYCGKELFVRDNEWSSKGRWHFHRIKDETFYVVSGILHLQTKEINADYAHEKEVYLGRGDTFRVLPGVRHRFRGYEGDCTFIEVSTHDEPEDSIRED